MLTYGAGIILTTLILRGIKAQTGGTTETGDSYVCVPDGYCSNNNASPGTPGIDPRIVTPGQLCPAGQVACITQGPNSKCSERFVIPVSTADGATANGVHPWQAFIQNSTNMLYAGSGVLIDNYHVLTAAHKVAGDVANPSNVYVTMGLYDPTNPANTNAQNRTAAVISLHPQYNPANYKNDIAIVRVSTPFSLSQTNINSACLPDSGTSPASYVGQTCIVAGWGETAFRQNDQPVNPMKQVSVAVVSDDVCRASFADTSLLGDAVNDYLDVNYAEICAGGVLNKDACTFDGGAPLLCPSTNTDTIAGLVIWGKGCGQPGVYGVYVSVAYYRGWIDTTITALNG